MSRFNQMFEAPAVTTASESVVVSFRQFATEHNLTGNFTNCKEPLYTKNHQIGELAGTQEPVHGVRFEKSNNDGTKGVVLMALSRNAARANLIDLMKAAGSLQVRIEQYNGYTNYRLETSADREAGDISGTFSF